MNEEKTKTLIVMSFFVTAGAMVSISTPDLDQTRGILWRANIIQHRSLITHSAILCWILFQAWNNIQHNIAECVIRDLCWIMFALQSIPLVWSKSGVEIETIAPAVTKKDITIKVFVFSSFINSYPNRYMFSEWNQFLAL